MAAQLAVELALLHELLEAEDEALAIGLAAVGSLGARAVAAAATLRARALPAIERSRAEARARSRRTLADELSAAAADADMPADLPAVDRRLQDLLRARRVATALGTRLLLAAVALGKREPLADPAQALTRSSRRSRRHAEGIATTEVADAFHDEREETTKRYAQRHPQERETGSIILVRIWDAEMDRRTCTTCERAHGSIVPFGFDFATGTPGRVHPRCRCYEGILALPFSVEYLEDAA